MSRLLCCLRASPDMGAALSHPGEVCDARLPADPPTMADVIRERKKKAGGAALGTLRRRLAAAARRGRDARTGGCEHARFIRGVVGAWRLGDVFALCEQLEGGAALRDLATQAELAREPAAALRQDLAAALRERRRCDVELVGAGWALAAHRALLAARCSYFRELLARHAGARVPLEGAAAALSREEVEAVVAALYGGAPPPAPGTLPRRSVCAACSASEWERGGGGSESEGGEGCACGRRVAAARLRRLGELLGFAPDALARDLRRALESGAHADTRLWWAGAGADCGFVRALELPCHRVVLSARSRFFRGVLARARPAVCVDDHVLPRRFARALLHAAYTDQVDLTLVGRSSSPTAAQAPAGPGRSTGARGSTTAMLDDAFQLYEIARFLEMPIVVQGCEDAIVRALSADTLPHVLRWAGGAHASAWVQRQAARYLRDEFVAVMAGPAAARLPRAALADALASPFLQASEPQALRALLRWAERAAAAAAAAEPNVVWHTRGRGRRAARPPDGGVRAALAGLAPLVRTEHVPPDCDALAAAVRRGLLAPAPAAAPRSPDAWLGRGAYRPPRCFLPYLDELKALLADQAPPPEGAARRARYLQRIPDTLYMVAAARERGANAGGGAPDAVRACVPAPVRQALRARARELRGSSTAARALALHAPDTSPVLRQIALRAVREMSLPDECADLLLSEPDPAEEREGSSEWGAGSEWGGSSSEWGGAEGGAGAECCRAGSLRCPSAASVRSLPRARPRPRLSAAVPDVAMAPNANTHLLSTREQMYAGPVPPRPAPARAPPPPAEPAPLPEPGGLQLDLGDGATHTPRPGSRAQRAARRELPTAREAARRGAERGERGEEEELRAAYELSARVYGGGSIRRLPRPADLLPDEYGMRSRASPSPSALSVAGSGSLALSGGSLALGGGSLALGGGALSLSGGELRLGGGELRLGGAALTLGGARRIDRHTPPPRHPRGGGGGGGGGGGAGRSPSPRRSPRALSALYSPHHSRGHSPNYA